MVIDLGHKQEITEIKLMVLKFLNTINYDEEYSKENIKNDLIGLVAYLDIVEDDVTMNNN